MTLQGVKQALPQIKELSALIDGYFHFLHDEGHTIHKNILPCPGISVIFSYAPALINGKPAPEVFVIGLHESIHRIEPVNSEVDSFVVRFAPGGCKRFTNMPVSGITEKILDGKVVFGEWIQDLHKSMKAVGNFSQKVALADGYFHNQLKQANDIDQAISQIAESIRKEPEPVFFDALQARITRSISKRQIARRFKGSIGVTLQTYLRICRFEMAKRMFFEEQGLSLTSIGYSSGYYDQAHFSKEFKELSGLNAKDFFPACSLQRILHEAGQ